MRILKDFKIPDFKFPKFKMKNVENKFPAPAGSQGPSRDFHGYQSEFS